MGPGKWEVGVPRVGSLIMGSRGSGRSNSSSSMMSALSVTGWKPKYSAERGQESKNFSQLKMICDKLALFDPCPLDTDAPHL